MDVRELACARSPPLRKSGRDGRDAAEAPRLSSRKMPTSLERARMQNALFPRGNFLRRYAYRALPTTRTEPRKPRTRSQVQPVLFNETHATLLRATEVRDESASSILIQILFDYRTAKREGIKRDFARRTR